MPPNDTSAIHRVMVNLSERDFESLNVLAERKGLAFSALIRLAVREYLERESTK